MTYKSTDPYRALDTLDNLKQAILENKAEGQKIVSHFKQMEEYYSNFEDRLNQIELAIQGFEKETGLDRKELLQPEPYDAFADGIFET